MEDAQVQCIEMILNKMLDRTPTLRDRFAMAALNGMLMTSMENAEAEGIESSDALHTIAKAAYDVADKMMEARKA